MQHLERTPIVTVAEESLVNVKLQVPAKAPCKDTFSQMGMGCSNKETISCKTENHNFQTPTIAPGLSFNEYTGNSAVTIKVDLFSSIVVKQFNDYYLTRTAPPREILSLYMSCEFDSLCRFLSSLKQEEPGNHIQFYKTCSFELNWPE